jgi:hypothetical protein
VKRIAFALVACAPAIAVAQQVPFAPGGQSPPVNLDPGAEPTQGKEKAPPPQPTQPQQPNVVVVRPDGTVTYGGQGDQGPGGYYVPSGGNAPQRDVEIHTGPVPELHVVRRGDTLWDICFYYFNDPWQWPKIWSYNPQITNPHWIYPGDLVRLLPRGVFISQPGVKDPEDPNANKKPDRVPPPQRRIDAGIKQIAFVEKDDLERSMKIEGTVDEKVLISNGDSVYISYPDGKPPQIGKRYSIYAADNQVKNGKEVVGAYVRVYGVVEVQSVRQDKRARGVIVEANKEIERGLLVGPLLRQFKNVPPVTPKVDVQGSIVAMLTREQLIGQGEVVFVNLGEGSGLEVGNRMFIVRRGDAYPPQMDRRIGQDDRRYPARELGEIVIVEVGKKVSIGLVTLSVQEIDVGDTVMMQKPK